MTDCVSLLAFAREDKRHLGNDRKLRLLLRQYFLH